MEPQCFILLWRGQKSQLEDKRIIQVSGGLNRWILEFSFHEGMYEAVHSSFSLSRRNG